MPVEMTQMCECRSTVPEYRQWWNADGSRHPSQGTVTPMVIVDLKKLVVGKQELVVLSYTCEWCGKEVGVSCVGSDGGQPGLPGVSL